MRKNLIKYSHWVMLTAVGITFPLLTGCGGSQHADFAPDGKSVVVSWPVSSDDMDLFRAPVDGGPVERLKGAERALAPKWSPDGRWIVFATPVTSPGVGASNQGASTPKLAVPGALPADGRKRDAPGKQGPIERIQTDLYDVQTQGVHSLLFDMGPPFAWEDDSRRLAGIRLTGDRVSICLYDIADAAAFMDVPIPSNPGGLDNSAMAWIPSTDAVAVILSGDVYLSDANQLHRLTTTGDVIGMGVGSAQQSLVWLRSKSVAKSTVTVDCYHLRDASVERVSIIPPPSIPPPAKWSAAPVGAHAEHAVVSPDGSRAVVVVDADVPIMGSHAHPDDYKFVFITDLKQPSLRLLARYSDTQDKAHSQGAGSGRNGGANSISTLEVIPSWSPDGKKLALVVSNPDPAVRVYNVDGAGSIRLPPPVVRPPV